MSELQPQSEGSRRSSRRVFLRGAILLTGGTALLAACTPAAPPPRDVEAGRAREAGRAGAGRGLAVPGGGGSGGGSGRDGRGLPGGLTGRVTGGVTGRLASGIAGRRPAAAQAAGRERTGSAASPLKMAFVPSADSQKVLSTGAAAGRPARQADRPDVPGLGADLVRGRDRGDGRRATSTSAGWRRSPTCWRRTSSAPR